MKLKKQITCEICGFKTNILKIIQSQNKKQILLCHDCWTNIYPASPICKYVLRKINKSMFIPSIFGLNECNGECTACIKTNMNLFKKLIKLSNIQ